MRRLGTSWAIVMAAAAPSLGSSQTRPTAAALAQLDQRIEAHMDRNNIPGVAVAVASRGEIIHLRTYGLANVELGVPVSDSTVFEIGSVAKQFVAVVAMQLVEEGRLELDSHVHDHLPWLPGEWRGATVRHLLNHTSGIPDYESIQGYAEYRNRFTPHDIVRVAHSMPPDFAPGEGHHYSNTGYFLLSLILEGIEAAPLGTVLAERIFTPLGMSRTRFADPQTIIPNRAAGYYQDRTRKLINRSPSETSSTLGAGGLVSTLSDLVRWDAALYTDELIGTEAKSLMWSPTDLPGGRSVDYGFGWRVEDFEGRRQQYHYGMTAGFIANLTRLPDDELVVVALANRYREDLGRIVVPTLRVFLGLD